MFLQTHIYSTVSMMSVVPHGIPGVVLDDDAGEVLRAAAQFAYGDIQVYSELLKKSTLEEDQSVFISTLLPLLLQAQAVCIDVVAAYDVKKMLELCKNPCLLSACEMMNKSNWDQARKASLPLSQDGSFFRDSECRTKTVPCLAIAAYSHEERAIIDTALLRELNLTHHRSWKTFASAGCSWGRAESIRVSLRDVDWYNALLMDPFEEDTAQLTWRHWEEFRAMGSGDPKHPKSAVASMELH